MWADRNVVGSQIPITWSRVLLEKLIVTHLVKKFHTFHGSQRYIIVFTRVPCVDFHSWRPILAASHMNLVHAVNTLLSWPKWLFLCWFSRESWVRWQLLWLVFVRCPVRILAGIPTIHGEGFCGFPQSFQVNGDIVLSKRPCLFPHRPQLVISQPIIECCIASEADSTFRFLDW
jgi:hypothetical protein